MKITRFNFYIHPHFIIKYYLLRDLQSIAHQYSFAGKILDIGCGEKPYRDIFLQPHTYLGIDFPNYSRNNTFQGQKPDYFFTDTYKNTGKLPFAKESFDHTFSFQVLEHHPNPSLLIAEMARITKKKGLILLSAPFIGGVHEKPHDYHRFTKYAFSEMFPQNDCQIITSKQQGSVSSVLTILSIDYLIEFANKGKMHYLIALLLFPFFLFLSYCCIVTDKIFPSENIYLNHVILAKKIK